MAGATGTCAYQRVNFQILPLISYREKLLWGAMLVGTGIIAILVYIMAFYIEWRDKEPVLKYEIVELKRQSERKILEQPSIKACLCTFCL
jgi:hypothetical protein